MRKAVWAIWFHKISSNSNPQHGLCSTGKDSWYTYKVPSDYDRKNSFPDPEMLKFKLIQSS